MRPDDWHLTHDLDAFLDRAGDFLRSRPTLHTVPLTVTEGLRRRGPRVYGEDDPLFGTLDTDGGIRAVFFRTPPHRIYLTSLTEEEAEALAVRLAAAGHRLPGVTADRDTAAAFAAAWQRRTGAASRLSERQRLHRLAELAAPGPAPGGRARVATAADRDLLVRWHDAFSDDIGGRNAQDSAGWADSRIAHGGVTLWETADGIPVSMAGVTPEVAGQIRVAPVYTPAGLRGRGYAGAATAEVSRVALASGAQVLLFTDLANPTSNALYRRIGYRPVADFEVYDFTAQPGSSP
ncbi:GNAT family N-acetyltransferase [Streptomyces sp. NPDC002962]|uniref:GNAT family N-acetyltransferase n=1 Tax=Streptomyces sp. NPDC002962 TaxID=3364674 RepID=UPI0036905588